MKHTRYGIQLNEANFRYVFAGFSHDYQSYSHGVRWMGTPVYFSTEAEARYVLDEIHKRSPDFNAARLFRITEEDLT